MRKTYKNLKLLLMFGGLSVMLITKEETLLHELSYRVTLKKTLYEFDNYLNIRYKHIYCSKYKHIEINC